MRRRRQGRVRFEAQDWVRQSAHPENYAGITWFKLGFLGLSWMTGPVEQVRRADANQPVELVFNLRV